MDDHVGLPHDIHDIHSCLKSNLESGDDGEVEVEINSRFVEPIDGKWIN